MVCNTIVIQSGIKEERSTSTCRDWSWSWVGITLFNRLEVPGRYDSGIGSLAEAGKGFLALGTNSRDCRRGCSWNDSANIKWMLESIQMVLWNFTIVVVVVIVIVIVVLANGLCYSEKLSNILSSISWSNIHPLLWRHSHFYSPSLSITISI